MSAVVDGKRSGDGKGAVEIFMHPIPDKALEAFYPNTR